MKKRFPLPLNIDCAGLRQDTIELLAKRLRSCFGEVKIWDTDITAGKPKSMHHYAAAWQLLDNYGVKVA